MKKEMNKRRRQRRRRRRKEEEEKEEVEEEKKKKKKKKKKNDSYQVCDKTDEQTVIATRLLLTVTIVHRPLAGCRRRCGCSHPGSIQTLSLVSRR